MLPTSDTWPSLPLSEWQATYETLHRWTQIVGKTRLALAPPQNHWWHATLYLSPRGLTTSIMPYGERACEIEFDFVDHVLVASNSDGVTRSMPLKACSVAAFFAEYKTLLTSIGVQAHIRPVPNELPDTLSFLDDDLHSSYDPIAAQRCWRILVQADTIFKKFRSNFLGKCSPSHFWWGAFDLSCTRFSGRRAPMHPGGVPNLPDWVTREAYSHECISAGWWPGSVGGAVAEPAFYAYAYPEPPGCADAKIRPEAGAYNTTLHEWILPYEAVRTAADPESALLAFLRSTYETAATLGGWKRAELERNTPDHV
jgi:hypothetical protein